MATVKIGDKLVGDGQPCFLIAEIGINHNGDLDMAKKLVSLAMASGCDAVKFQKRTVDVVYSAQELARPRESPFGSTNGDLKRGLEFGRSQYEAIATYCRDVKIPWLASCWDEAAVDFIEAFSPPCYKVASASLTDDKLLRYTRAKGRPILLSTGMTSEAELDHAVEVLGTQDLILLHTCSTYPAQYSDLNLRALTTLRQRYGVPVGYSGHESGLAPSIAAAALGACVIERHITLDRALWGSDQAASVGPTGLTRLVRDIRLVEASMGDGVKRVQPSEVPIMQKLRRVTG
jgi:N-acetylneuraminate synthase